VIDRHTIDSSNPVPAETSGELERMRADVRRLRAENRTLLRLNRLQGRFVAMASHEFKTPLTSITAYTDALLVNLDDQGFDRAPQFLGVIRDESARLLRMVNRILDFSRLEYGSRLLERTLTDLGELVSETMGSLEPLLVEKHQHLELAVTEGLPLADIDADLIRQVLVNLGGNAVKYTPAGGRIGVVVRETPTGLAVTVEDDGPGIPAEKLQSIFGEFYRAEETTSGETGTGLGLSIVRHIVRLHGGQVEARRRRPRGSSFTFSVPKEISLLAGAADHDESVLRNLIRLVAGHTGAKAAVLLTADVAGSLAPAAAMGLPGGLPGFPAATGDVPVDAEQWLVAVAGSERTGAWRLVPLQKGALLLGRRRGGGSWLADDDLQVAVLARVADLVLAESGNEPARTAEALRVLHQIHRRGVPTATPSALALAASLGRRLGLDDDATDHLLYAAALHDAGMARVDDEILLGGGELGWDERDEIDRHVELGLDLLAPLLPETEVVSIVRHHHERADGSGHPDGLAGPGIPLGARVLAVVDAWCSLTSDRPYRAGLTPEAALAEIRRCAGTQFDPAVVAALAAETERPEPQSTGAGSGARNAD